MTRNTATIRNTLLISLLAAILLLGACSGSANNGVNGNTGNADHAGQAGNSGNSGNTSGNDAARFPRSIQDARGQVTIEKQPKRVAIAHWGYTDSILLFDLNAVGVTLPFGQKNSVLESDPYKPYIEKAGELAVVGENTTVNMEALLAFAPDLIIAGNATNGEIVDQLKGIATTVVIDEEKVNVWGDWPALVGVFGEILGQEKAAEQYLADYRQLLADGKEKLANVEGTVAFVQVRGDAVWLQAAGYVPQYYDGLGLKALDHALMAEGGQLSLEGLSELNPDHLFLGYFNVTNSSLGALTDEWENTQVWKNLNAVQNNRVYAINGELALGYGPIGNTYGVNAVIEALQQ